MTFWNSDILVYSADLQQHKHPHQLMIIVEDGRSRIFLELQCIPDTNKIKHRICHFSILTTLFRLILGFNAVLGNAEFAG